MEGKTTVIVFWGSKYCFLWFPLNGLVNPSLSRRDANMMGLREREEGAGEMERAFWWDNRQNKCLSIYSFHQNESTGPSIVSFLSLCVSWSVGCAHSGGLCTVSRSERKSKRGVKLTSSFENSTVHGRFHICAASVARGSNIPQICSIQGPRKRQRVTL